MQFPNIDPVAFQVGSFPIRWYGIAYIAGIYVGGALAKTYVKKWPEFGLSPRRIDDFAFWAIIGIMAGGRVGYIFLYQLDYYLADYRRVFELQNGGMSFHGGFVGVALAAILFCKERLRNVLCLTDVVACVVPIGLCLGRLANFVNGELWGRATNVPWAMVFPTGGPVPRHPSQLYEAILEGGLMLLVLNILVHRQRVRDAHGTLTACFLVLYSLIRFVIEFVREPDAHLILGFTRGQIYSLPMFVLGAILLSSSRRLRDGPPQDQSRRAGIAGHR